MRALLCSARREPGYQAVGSTAVFKDTLEMVPTGFDFDPAKLYLLQSWTGTGRVFYFDLPAKTLKVWQDSVSTPLVSDFRDPSGAFTITSIAGAGVDRKEKYLYFSAATQDSGSTATVWRLSKTTARELAGAARRRSSPRQGGWARRMW